MRGSVGVGLVKQHRLLQAVPAREGAGTRRRGRVGMSALKTLALVVLAVILGSVTTELLAGGSALVWLVASALWTWLLLRGHGGQETHEE